MKNILVLCENLKYFERWCNTFINWHAATNYKKMGLRFDIEVNGEYRSYRVFTPQMNKDVLYGCRFNSIIDNIGLSENEKMWFNILIRPQPEFTGGVVFEVKQ